jgi:hypothetical protein
MALQRGVGLPRLREQADVFVGVLVAMSRLGLGAFAGFIFHEEITGPYAAIVVGAAAPAILKQLNAVPGIRRGDRGTRLASLAHRSVDQRTARLEQPDHLALQ